MSKVKRHFSMRIDSELFEKIQQYADRKGTNATAVVEESVRLALPKQLDQVSCRIRALDEGTTVRMRCELFVPAWSHTERWEGVSNKGDAEERKVALDVLSKRAETWVAEHLDLEGLEIAIED